MNFRDREIDREMKFPDRESREKFMYFFGAFIFAQRKTVLADSDLHGNQI